LMMAQASPLRFNDTEGYIRKCNCTTVRQETLLQGYQL
jgi:hypothetical protein